MKRKDKNAGFAQKIVSYNVGGENIERKKNFAWDKFTHRICSIILFLF
jgi:hypothetical protein